MNKNESITVDISLSDPMMTIEKYKTSIEKKYHLTMKILVHACSDGGDPVISVSGPIENLKKWFVKDYCAEKTMKDALESIGIKSFDEMLDSNDD